MLIKRFGDRYRSYVKHTGRLIPLIRPEMGAQEKRAVFQEVHFTFNYCVS
jgi:hypothetical protein